MAYTMRCSDVVPGCAATFEGDSEDDILRQAAEHARADHGMDEIDADTLEKVKGAIRP